MWMKNYGLARKFKVHNRWKGPQKETKPLPQSWKYQSYDEREHNGDPSGFDCDSAIHSSWKITKEKF